MKRGAVPHALVAVLFAACGAAGCGGEPAPDRTDPADAPVARDSAGVAIVDNPGVDRTAALEVQQVGVLMGSGGFQGPGLGSVAVDPAAGRIYLVGAQGHTVRVLDTDGNHVRTLGRDGRGPGEFTGAHAVAVERDGTLLVLDPGRGIVARWSADGALLDESRIPVAYWGPGLEVVDGGLVTVSSTTRGPRLDQELVRVGGDGTARTLHIVPRELRQVEFPCGNLEAYRVFSPTVVWDGGDGLVHAQVGRGYRIDSWSGDRRVRSVRREVPPVEIDEEAAAERAALEMYGFLERCGIGALPFVRALGWEEEVTPVQAIAAIPGGGMAVSRTLDAVAPVPVDLFDAGGRYQGTVQAPGMPVAFLSPDRFVAVALNPRFGELSLTLNRFEGALVEQLGRGGGTVPGEAGRGRAAPEGMRRRAGGAGLDVQAGARAETGARPPLPGDAPLHPGVTFFTDCRRCPEMAALPGGTVVMGAAEGEAPAAADPTRPDWKEASEQPQVGVTLRPFAIGRFEVTFAQWDACVEAGGCAHTPDDEGWGRGARPVIHLSWDDARAYAAWLSQRTGHRYRLPTESEWEHAARGGTVTARWWGDGLDGEYVACDGCGTRWDRRSTAPVGSFPANPFGLHDVIGNVAEMVEDCWSDDHRGAHADGSPRRETSPYWRNGTCTRPLYRGGASVSTPGPCAPPTGCTTGMCPIGAGPSGTATAGASGW